MGGHDVRGLRTCQRHLDGADAGRADRLGDIARNLYRNADLYDHRDEESAANVEQTL